MAPQLILASTSKYRRELLARLGWPFQCVAPDVNETVHQQAGHAPQALAELLADLKAHAVAQQFPEAVVIGSDQLAAAKGTILGKPGSRDAAMDQLRFLSGTPHALITAVTLRRGNECWRHTDITTLLMHPLTDQEIAAYVDRDQPWDCAGSYKLEQHGIGLFQRIESQDFTAITGLPLIAVGNQLRAWGIGEKYGDSPSVKESTR